MYYNHPGFACRGFMLEERDCKHGSTTKSWLLKSSCEAAISKCKASQGIHSSSCSLPCGCKSKDSVLQIWSSTTTAVAASIIWFTCLTTCNQNNGILGTPLKPLKNSGMEVNLNAPKKNMVFHRGTHHLRVPQWLRILKKLGEPCRGPGWSRLVMPELGNLCPALAGICYQRVFALWNGLDNINSNINSILIKNNNH